MNCTSKYKEMLGEYIRGVLSKTEIDLVKEHLKGCSECSLMTEQIKILYPGLKYLSNEHISLESLVEYHHLSKINLSQIEFSEWKREQIEEHLEICDNCQSELGKLQALERELVTEKVSIWQSAVKELALKLSNFFTFPKLRYALVATVGILAILLIRNQFFAPKLAKETIKKEVITISFPLLAWVRVDLVSSQAFAHGGIRGRSDSVLAQSAKEAALDEFIGRIKLVGGEVEFLAGNEIVQPTEPKRNLWLLLKDENGNHFKEFMAAIPHIDTPSSDTTSQVQAWLIAFPSRELNSVDMTSDSVQTIWNLEKGKEICVTFTYKVGNKYRATPASFADLTNQSKESEQPGN